MRGTDTIMILTAALLLAGTAAVGARVTVVSHKGAPALAVDSQPRFPLFLFEQEVAQKDGQAFGEAGFRFYSFIERSSCLDMGWVDDDRSDFAVIDRVLKTNAERTRGYLLPRIHVWAPDWWTRKYPEELVGYALPDATDGESGPPGRQLRNQSFASQLWKRQGGEALRRLVRHILAGPYADRVMGIHVAAGAGGEWHQFGSYALPDTSEPMRKAFAAYLRNKYHSDVKKLRVAWGDASANFENVTIPDAAERRAADVGIFRDPSRSRKVADYYECYHRVTVEAIGDFCKIVKSESKGRLLTFVLYGYAPDMPYLPQEVHHRASALLERSPCVDVVAAPHSYWNRGVGQSGALRHYVESLALHGKLFVDEGDDRTHRADPNAYGYHARTPEESVNVLQRAFGNVVTRGAGIWFMDQSSGTWYDDPDIRASFAKIQKWADYSMTLSRQSAAEVAVITSAESEFYIANRTDFTAGFYEGPQGQIDGLTRSGAAVGRYLIEDLTAGLVPAHKVYVFLDCFHLNRAQRAAIEALKKNDNTLIFYYAPGFVSDSGLSLGQMQSLTGISFRQQTSGGAEVVLEPGVAIGPQRFGAPDPTGHDPKWIASFATNTLSPRFVPSASGATVLGRYADTGEPALVRKDFGRWHAVYCPRTPMPSALLRRIFADAGVHIYCDTDDVISANQSWLMIHAATSGPKKIRLKSAACVRDAINDKVISSNTDAIDITFEKGGTAVFSLVEPQRSGPTRSAD